MPRYSYVRGIIGKTLRHERPRRLLDQVPGHFDGLNDIIKGCEVFSNGGAVVQGGILTRFIATKDTQG